MPEYKVTDNVDPSRNVIVIADNKAQALRIAEQDRLSAVLISGPALIDAIQGGLPVLRQRKTAPIEQVCADDNPFA